MRGRRTRARDRNLWQGSQIMQRVALAIQIRAKLTIGDTRADGDSPRFWVYYYCVIRTREDSTGNVAGSGRGGLRSAVAQRQWIEGYAVLSARAAPRGLSSNCTGGMRIWISAAWSGRWLPEGGKRHRSRTRKP